MDFFYKFIDLPLQFCYNGENTGKEAPRVTDRQIRCFLSLYETLNFSAAARQLFLTQPTLSYQIRTLEEELGTPLFTRTTCRVEPTEAGQLFAAFAQNVRQSYQAFQHALAAGPARREKLVLQVPPRPAAGAEPGAAGL